MPQQERRLSQNAEGADDEQQPIPPEKTKAWQEKLEEIETVQDSLSRSIDAKIRETIVALNLLGMPTAASLASLSNHRCGVIFCI